MIPLKDDIPTRTVPFVTVTIIAINVAVFVRSLFLPQAMQQALLMRLALIPHDLTQPVTGRIDLVAYNLLTLLTSMFVHGGWLHLLGNMLYLWIFGNNIEDVLGHGRYALFYLICGLSGAAAQIAADPASRVPMIGASGAIAGVLGAYLVTFPAARVSTLIFVLFFARIVEVPALIVLGFWLLIQLMNAGRTGPAGVAWFAHLGGFLAGLLLVVLLRRRRLPHSLY